MNSKNVERLLCSPINRSCETSSLTRQVELEVEAEEMLEGVFGYTADSSLTDVCEDGVHHFTK